MRRLLRAKSKTTDYPETIIIDEDNNCMMAIESRALKIHSECWCIMNMYTTEMIQFLKRQHPITYHDHYCFHEYNFSEKTWEIKIPAYVLVHEGEIKKQLTQENFGEVMFDIRSYPDTKLEYMLINNQ